MIKRLILAIIGLIMIVTGSAMLAYGQEIDIDIITENIAINVAETHIIDTIDGDTIAFWIQSGHSNVVITINDLVITPSPSNYFYYVNVSGLNITSENIIKVKYNLEKNTVNFEKILQYNTTSLTIKFDGNELYFGNNLVSGSYLNLALQKQVPGQIVENIPIWIYIIIIVLVILLIAVFIGLGRKQKTTAKKEGIGGSEELLATKKALLMETLKEIEKRHRSKQISDDTYHKLKGEFKQDAVEAMKQLEDLK